MTVTSKEGHIIIDSQEDIIFKSNGVERARIDSAGDFTGFAQGAAPVVPNPDLVATFAQPGVLNTGLGSSRFRMPFAGSIVSAVASVGTAPTGQALKCDINKNGTTIFTTQANRPTINAASSVSSVSTPDVTAFVAGDFLTVDIDQVGSGTAGSDLTVQVIYVFS